jgi:Putative MetA-pathway of phenol degradation
MEYPRRVLLPAVVAILAGQTTGATAADECTQTSAPIATDRPDVTNSSVVVPVGSLQNENGANVSRRGGVDIFDGTNSRWRLGIAPCFEVLIDLPNYVGTFRGAGDSGFGNVAPAFKWQISPVPGKVDLSMTIGAGLPTGALAIAGPGVQPYLQFPWSVELGRGWAITGMVTNFFTPANPVNKYSNQSTFVIEKEIGERSFLFIEYVGDFPVNGGTSQLFNSGGGYRITDTRQIDFHLESASTVIRPRIFSAWAIRFGWTGCSNRGCEHHAAKCVTATNQAPPDRAMRPRPSRGDAGTAAVWKITARNLARNRRPRRKRPDLCRVSGEVGPTRSAAEPLARVPAMNAINLKKLIEFPQHDCRPV